MASSSSPPPRSPVRFLPFRSVAEPSFWLDHSARKLDELRLSEEGVPLRGFFGASSVVGSGSASGGAAPPPPGMRFDASSSNPGGGGGGGDDAGGARRNEWMRCRGAIHSLNTLESLKKINKNAFLNDACLPSLLRCCGIDGGDGGDDGEDDPNLALVPAACLTFCNLKTNITVYWFAFPALVPRSGRGIAYSAATARPQRRLADAWGNGGCRTLSGSFHRFRVLREKEATGGGRGSGVWCPPFFLLLTEADGSGRIKNARCLPLDMSTYDALSEEERERVIFGFVDPSGSSAGSDADLEAVGWTLRNLVAYLSLRLGLGGKDVTFLSYRSPFLRRITPSEMELMDNSDESDNVEDSYEDVGDDDAGIGGSLLLEITIPLSSDYRWPNSKADEASQSPYRCVGWELNKNGKPGPRSVDLRPLVSPAHLARQANDLNLRLMKWRALPELDVDRLSKMKVLLLGAGTLGCGVARTLLGWGVRKITLVDSGRVSYSNPVRQSLFGVDDCKDGGRYKAIAAAESLVKVAGPDVKSDGVVLTIPMPGHSFGKKGGGKEDPETQSVRKEVAKLHSLMEESDVVFLLTDTRESRWLPTVMALATETPLVNAALGLDSWLVMRHGPPSSALSKIQAQIRAATGDTANEVDSDRRRLGCYFCSDVVAPENSTRDRTLDQQCTVTRPGLAPIAASMATELMVAMAHHPLGHSAPAPTTGNGDNGFTPMDDGRDASSCSLGRLPHQIRGTVATYTMMTPTVPYFPSCTACSDCVVEEYRKEGFEFVRRVCCDLDGAYLEKVSGLDRFREEAARKMEECLDWDDEDIGDGI